jgi:hypothetical protein
MQGQLAQPQHEVVVTQEEALLQEVGVHQYRHPLTEASVRDDATPGGGADGGTVVEGSPTDTRARRGSPDPALVDLASRA